MKHLKLFFGSIILISLLGAAACNKDTKTDPKPDPVDTSKAILKVNELMTKDTIGLVYIDVNGKKCDWSEFYNAGSKDLDIAGYYIADDGESSADADKYEIPSDNPKATTIKAKSYLVIVWGAKDANGQDYTGIHNDTIFCPSSLSAKKDKAVAVWDKTGKFIDESENFTVDGPLGKLPDGKSIGRLPDGTDNWKLFDIPTPGAKNQ